MLGSAVSRKENFIQEALPGIPARSVSSGNVYIPPVHLPKTPKRPLVEQLAMYKTPKEIITDYNPLRGDMHGGETPKDTWDRKAEEGRKGLSGNSRVNSFYGVKEDDPDTLENSIRREGVQNPVTIQPKDLTFGYRPEVFGGHHRIATANKINPNMLIPVEYADSYSDASTNQRRQGDDPGSPDKPRFPYNAKESTSSSSSSSKTSSSNKS
jgi:hypothetical protein